MNKFSYRIIPGLAKDPLADVWPKVHAVLEKELADVDAHVAFVSAKIDFPNVAGSFFADDFDPKKYGGSYMSRRWTKALEAVFETVLAFGPDRIDTPALQFEFVALPQKGADKTDLWRDHLGRVGRFLKTESQLAEERAERIAKSGESLLRDVANIAAVTHKSMKSAKREAEEHGLIAAADKLAVIEKALEAVGKTAKDWL